MEGFSVKWKECRGGGQCLVARFANFLKVGKSYGGIANRLHKKERYFHSTLFIVL